MAYPIFICDNNVKDINKVKLIIDYYVLFHSEEFKIEKATTSPSELLEYITNEEINSGVYFLDLDFQQEMNGIDLALKIRKTDINAKIIFTSYCNSHANLILKNNIEAVNYIDKSQDIDSFQEEIINSIKYCYSSIVEQKKKIKSIFKFSIKSDTYFIDINDIIFIENSQIPHVLTLVTKTSSYNFYEKISVLDKKYDGLYKISRSCLINPKNITRIDYCNRQVHLKENITKKFSLSKSKLLKSYSP